MRKYKLNELKSLIATGHAENLTNAKVEAIPTKHEKVGYSSGVYGINGGLIEDENGKFYAITARNSMLFRLF